MGSGHQGEAADGGVRVKREDTVQGVWALPVRNPPAKGRAWPGEPATRLLLDSGGPASLCRSLSGPNPPVPRSPTPPGFPLLYDWDLAGLPPATLMELLRHPQLQAHCEMQVRDWSGSGNERRVGGGGVARGRGVKALGACRMRDLGRGGELAGRRLHVLHAFVLS